MANTIRRSTIVVTLATLLLGTACGGGKGGGGVTDGNDAQQAAFNFNEANARYAAGAAARAIDAFPPVADLLDATIASLWQTSAPHSGQPVALSSCVEGSASFVWTDTNGDGAWSVGDLVVVAPRGCRVHGGDAEVLTGDVGLTFKSVSRGPPRAIAAVFEPALGVEGGNVAGTIRGRAEVTASSPDGVRNSFAFLPSGTSLLSITGDASLDFGCFDVRHDYDPAFGIARRVAILGNLRTLGKMMSFSPGGKLLYGADDRPAQGGSVTLLSFMDQPNCPAFGVTDGVGDSDGSTLTLSARPDGAMQLTVHRPGQADRFDSCDWSGLLHPTAPHQGLIDSTNAIAVASAAVTALGLPRDVGALATDLMLGVYRGSPVPLCTSGGYSVSPTPTLAVGQKVTIAFTGCTTTALGPAVRLDGSAALTVASVGGAPAGDTYALSVSIAPIDVTTTASGETSRVTGSSSFSRTSAAGDVTEQSQAIPGAALVLTETLNATTAERRIAAFSVSSATSANGGFTFASAGDAATIATGSLAGDLAMTVGGAVRGTRQAMPETGSLKITAADATSLTLTVGTGGAVVLGLDGNGDGSVDASIETAWDELR